MPSKHPRALAKSSGEKYYFTGKSCPSGHVAKRSTIKGVCYECQLQSGRDWKKANPLKVRLYGPVYVKKMTAEQKEKHRLAVIERYHRVVKHNPHQKRVRLYHTRKRQKAVVRATPSWADESALKEIYLNRPDGHEVDHIVPLQGRTVCGLHVPWNLQYLTVAENRRKPRIFVP